MQNFTKANIFRLVTPIVYNCYNYPNTKLKAGDLMFFKSTKLFGNNFLSAVITSSPTEKTFYHVAIVVKSEAKAVTLLDTNPEQGVVVKEYRNVCKTHGLFSDIEILRTNLSNSEITKAVDNALSLVGNEYNDLFSNNFINSKGNKSFYCSQIIQHVFNMATQKDIFPNIPMNFKDHTGKISEYWQDYYNARSSNIPQDAPGSHPASIYESEFLICF